MELGQQFHLHQTIQYKQEFESLSIVPNGHHPVDPRPGFENVGNEISDEINPETVLPRAATSAIHFHFSLFLAHGAKLLDANRIGTCSNEVPVHIVFSMVSKSKNTNSALSLRGVLSERGDT
jgi:hypothetical protein